MAGRGGRGRGEGWEGEEGGEGEGKGREEGVACRGNSRERYKIVKYWGPIVRHTRVYRKVGFEMKPSLKAHFLALGLVYGGNQMPRNRLRRGPARTWSGLVIKGSMTTAVNVVNPA